MTLWIGYARAGKEFEVEQAIRDLGVAVRVARKIEAKRVPTKRTPEPVVTPYLRNYVFVDCPPDRYLDVIGVKHLASTMQAIGINEARHVARWLDDRQSEFDQCHAKIEAGERIGEYQEGDALEILKGPLAGLFATFRRIVESDHEVFPRAEVEVEFMGGKRRANVDILDVRKAG